MDRPAVDLNALRARIVELKLANERAVVAELIDAAGRGLTSSRRAAALNQSRMLTSRCRDHAEASGTLDAFLKQFGLSNPEGVALMCLAEALLRVPDDDTADRLIAEKINSGDWAAYLGESDSLFVNGSVWGLMLTGRLVTLEPEAEGDPGSWVRQLVSRVGEPIVRSAVVQAMRILGRQYVLGRTMEEALARAAGPSDVGDLYSFDMLGEGARTWADAERYEAAYRDAIEAIGSAPAGADPRTNHGISIKLSALHPRFEESQRDGMLDTLTESLTSLARLARSYELGFSIDAEEADRLELTLDLFERLARAPELAGWAGLGFVLQAYQKRAPAVAGWLIALARDTGRTFMVRLVKGAYWDAEIKHAQELGLTDYPVYTRKPNSDLCYEVCAAQLLSAPDAIYPQFATHNATTACQVLELGGDQDFELQRLHGMGELMFAELDRETGQKRVPLRVYAPVGSHEDLLPYLVRRLLENGANSSFVNRFLDEQIPVDELVQDPLLKVREAADARHSRIPKPMDLYLAAGEPRQNSTGLDLTVPGLRQDLKARFATLAAETFSAGDNSSAGGALPVRSPANNEHIVG
ncbi:MAG: proline dehydrogenase family protein, partial [Pseudomonadota bacterium]